MNEFIKSLLIQVGLEIRRDDSGGEECKAMPSSHQDRGDVECQVKTITRCDFYYPNVPMFELCLAQQSL